MPVTRALLVGEPGDIARELDRTLRADGFEVERATPAELVTRPRDGEPPDLLLVTASVGPRGLAGLSERLARAGTAPVTLVFPDGDLAALESCVQGGYDYITPPFLPSLLRARVNSCRALLREYERELSIAHEIQSGFLPDELIAPDGWEVAARFEPAKHVGGDFYDVFELINGQRLGFVVADVCDKGVGAALFMALIRTLVRHTAEHAGTCHVLGGHQASVPPALSLAAGPLVQTVVSTNRYLARNHLRQGYFATMFFGILDPASGSLLYINGGHNPPVLCGAGGRHTRLHPTGPAVGLMANSTYTLGYTCLAPGDTLFVYTDGVIDARDAHGAPFGTDRMVEVVSRPGLSAEALLDGVDEAIRRHAGATEQADDITMLAVRRKER